METGYKILSELHPANDSIRLLLNGKFDEEALPELERSIDVATSAAPMVFIDLSEVTLVDRKAVQFFSDQASPHVKLVNCPIYLRRWIAQVSDENES
jgi:ABC-type transporter Mla MlaB component